MNSIRNTRDRPACVYGMRPRGGDTCDHYIRNSRPEAWCKYNNNGWCISLKAIKEFLEETPWLET